MFFEKREWTLTGSEGLPLRGATLIPPAESQRFCAVVVHGFMGTKDRNIVPAISLRLAMMGGLVHAFNLAHCGIGADGDTMTRLDEMERDSWRFTHEDVLAVLAAIDAGELPGAGLPFVLAGHSRGGGAVVGYAGRARREGWREPDGVVSLAGIRSYSVLTDTVRRELATKGVHTVKSKRAKGGVVRCGPSWFAEHDEPIDVFEADAKHGRAPVLLVHGEDDDTVPPVHAAAVQEILEAGDCPGVRLAVIPDADHNFNAKGVGNEHENIHRPEVVACAEVIEAWLAADVL
ncbi:MAG: prolyl oligopeptidase family serine peptidase [Phycisphaerales bacterium]